MLAQKFIDPRLAQATPTPGRGSSLFSVSWQTLPIAKLDGYTTVDQQFLPLGLIFQDAIALRPSNPRFTQLGNPVVLMPVGQCRGLKVQVHVPIQSIDLGLMGSKGVTVSALNEQGHCVAIAQTQDIDPTTVEHIFPEQFLRLDVSTVQTLRIESKAPFLLTRFAFEPAVA